MSFGNNGYCMARAISIDTTNKTGTVGAETTLSGPADTYGSSAIGGLVNVNTGVMCA